MSSNGGSVGGDLDRQQAGRTVAVPLTQQQALRIMQGAIDDAEPGHEAECVAALVPEVLAAAMGGHVSHSGTGVTCIVLPPREVSCGD